MRFLQRIFLILAVFGGFIVTATAEERTGNLYWAPQNATVGGERVDQLLNVIFALTLAVFVLTQVVYIFYLAKYRRRPGYKAHYNHGNNTLEILWTTIPTAIFLLLAVWSNRVWHDLTKSPPPADSLTVGIFSYQFGWDIRYPGADGKLGVTDVKHISLENKFGVAPEDSAGKDDFTSTEFVIPVGKPVHILLHSRDVIHSFYVPQFRIYQDAVPGRSIQWIWFQTTRTGDFELACNQLCGVGHYNMKARIRVLPQADYDKWYAGKVQAAASAATDIETSAPQIATH